MLQLLWNTIAYSGSTHASHTSEVKHIVLLNALAMITAAFALFNLPVTLFVHAPFSVICGTLAFSLLMPLVTIILNGRGHLLAARFWFLIVSSGRIVLGMIFLGSVLPLHFFFLALMTVSFFVFPAKQKKLMIATCIVMLSAFIGFELFRDQIPLLAWMKPEYIQIQRVAINAGFGILTFCIAFYIYSTFDRSERYLHAEQSKSERLLNNILPGSIVRQLRESPDTIAERFENCTVLFSDIVGFTSMSRQMPAVQVVELLNGIFSAFDDLAEKHGLEKIKTIGDAYMIVGGLPEPDPHHAENVARFALEMLDVVRQYRQENGLPLELRIGINSGDAVAGVIGKKKFIYDLWGDSVNTASRMESHGLPGQIQVTESTYMLLKDKFQFSERGSMEVKGLGIVKSYLLMEAV